MHVQKEVRLGVFDKTLSEYETFEEGLLRYKKFCVCKNDKDRIKLDYESQKNQITKSQLDFATDIRPFKAIDSCSEYDKFERSEEMGEPIRVKEFLLDTREIVSDSNSDSDEDKRNLIEDIQE